jgi:hypothetical protein
VHAIVEEEAGQFDRWLSERSVSEVISELRAKAESVRQECLGLAGRKLSDDEFAAVAYLLDLLVRKLLHDPISAIREAAADGGAADLLAAARRLFGLEQDDAAEGEAGAVPTLAGAHQVRLGRVQPPRAACVSQREGGREKIE